MGEIIPKGPANLGPVRYGLDGGLLCLSTSSVLVHLGTRAWITRILGWDDASIAVTQVVMVNLPFSFESLIVVCRDLVVGSCRKSHCYEEVINGLGQHEQDLSPTT